MIISIWRNLWHLSAGKKSASVRILQSIANLFWLLWACMATHNRPPWWNSTCHGEGTYPIRSFDIVRRERIQLSFAATTIRLLGYQEGCTLWWLLRLVRRKVAMLHPFTISFLESLEELSFITCGFFQFNWHSFAQFPAWRSLLWLQRHYKLAFLLWVLRTCLLGFIQALTDLYLLAVKAQS